MVNLNTADMNNVVLSTRNIDELVEEIADEVVRRIGVAPTSKISIDDTKDIITINEAAEFLSLTVPTIYSKVSKREIPYMKKSGRLYFSRKDLLGYVKTGRVKTRLEAIDEAHLHLKPKKKRRGHHG